MSVGPLGLPGGQQGWPDCWLGPRVCQMVDGQVVHTPTSNHKYYHPTMPLNFFVTSLVTSSPSLCTCLSTITSMTSVISPTTYLYYCHHSHQHQYSFYSPTMSLTSSVSSLEKFQWKNHKVVCFYQPIRKATNIRPLRIKTSDFMIFPLKYLQGTHGGSQRHGWGVEWVLVLVAVMTIVQVGCWGDNGCHWGDGV